MKRVLALLLCFVLLVGVLASCAQTNSEEKHEHTYSSKLSSDASGHWYEATCDCEDANVRKLAHTDENNDGKCDFCKYTSHEHTYSEEWTADCTNHWHAADCGHTVAGSELYPHQDANNDGKCDECNYVIDDIHEHYYDTEWSYDNDNHWHEALCEHFVEVADKAAHETNAAGFCTVCGAKVKDVDTSSIDDVLAAAAVMNNKVTSGNVLYTSTIRSLDFEIVLSHEAYYVLGNGYSYLKRTEDGFANQFWYEYISDDEVFGVCTYDSGVTIEPVSADQDNLDGYMYMPSTLADSSTLDGILSALYAFSKADTAKNVRATYEKSTGIYSFSFEYLDVQVISGRDDMTDVGNDDATGETQEVIVTALYGVEASFRIDENFVITEADFTVNAYSTLDEDYVYDEENGTYTKTDIALADSYTYKVAQTSGERVYVSEYPKSSVVPTDFDLVDENGNAVEEINTVYGEFVNLALGNLKPFSAYVSAIDMEDISFEVIRVPATTDEPFQPYYNPYGGTVGFYPNAVGTYTMTVKYLGNVKTYTVNVVSPSAESVNAYKFDYVDGYDGPVYTADQYNPGPTSSVSLEVGEYFDFLVRVAPFTADQKYTVTVSGGELTEVTLENVIAFYEQLESCTAYRFTADTEGEYVITITSEENPEITTDLTVYVGVEPDTPDSETFVITTPGEMEQSGEYTFTAGTAGTYTITAEGLDPSSWLQIYDILDDSWINISSDLPYSVYLESGDNVTLRIFGWSQDAAGTQVNVTVALGEGGDNPGGDNPGGDVGTGTGTYDDPYVITVDDYVCSYQGGWETVWYTFTSNEDGYILISTSANAIISIGNAFGANASNSLGYDDDFNEIPGESAMLYAPAGCAFSIAIRNVVGEEAAEIPFTVEFIPFTSEDLSYISGTWVCEQDGMVFTLVLNADGTGTYFEDFGWSQCSSTIGYAFLNGSDLVIGATDTDGYSMAYNFVYDGTNLNLDDMYIFTLGEGGGTGGDTPTDPTLGTLENPIFIYDGGDLVCEFPGGNNNVYYAVPVRMAGYVTVSSTDAKAWIAAGLDPNTVMYNGTNTVKVYVPYGYTCYIAVSTQEGDAADVSFNVNFEPFFSDDYAPFIGTWVAESGSYLTIDEYAMGTYVESAWWGTATYSIEYLVVNGNTLLIGVIDEYTNRITLNLTYADGALTTVPQSIIEMPTTFVPGTVVVEPENNELVLGNYEIAAKDETLIYTATEDGTLTLTMGAAIMGPVSATYSINDGEAVELPLSSSASLTLVAGDVVTVTVTASGYSSITADFTEGGASVPAEPITAGKSISDLITSEGWDGNTTKQSFNLDENVTVKVDGGNNSGKAYNGDHIRIYATDTPAGTLTITVADGYELATVTVTTVTGTYAFLCLGDDTADISNSTVEVSGNTVILNSVKNGSNGKQVRVLAIEVTYVAVN